MNNDFEATIRIYTAEEGGRRTPAMNGIRWDFAYAEDDTLYAIWPTFLVGDEDPLPVGVDLPARMFIVSDDLRAKVHCKRITPGVKFFCHEGRRRVAEGVVTNFHW